MDVNSLPKTVTRQRRDCDLNPLGYRATRPSDALSDTAICSVRLSVPRRSCLGYRYAGYLQLSHRGRTYIRRDRSHR